MGDDLILKLGYVLGNSLTLWGIDHSSTIETVQSDGARTSFLYADKKARINAYGDRYTECEQVSDGETWEEYLAGHLGEPIRNFGASEAMESTRPIATQEAIVDVTHGVVDFLSGCDTWPVAELIRMAMIARPIGHVLRATVLELAAVMSD